MDAPRSRLLHQGPLISPDGPDSLMIHAQDAKAACYRGKQCLRVENGLIALTDPRLAALSSGRVEVDIAAEGPAYPGIAFRIADQHNYELMYSQPHSSGQWDALQYDPVFQGSNTWQIYHGPNFQKGAIVPIGEWYTLVVEFYGRTASVHLPGQEPLTVESLAMPQSAGAIGIWTYLPAYFCNMRVYAGEPEGEVGAVSAAKPGMEPSTETATQKTPEQPEAAEVPVTTFSKTGTSGTSNCGANLRRDNYRRCRKGNRDTNDCGASSSETSASLTKTTETGAAEPSTSATAIRSDTGVPLIPFNLDELRKRGKECCQILPPGLITAWLAEGYGVVHCEPHGILNLNRYFPLSLKEVTLTRRFTLQVQSKIIMSFGLSDDLTLSIDGLPLYASTKPFRPTAGATGRGYIEFDTCKMTRVLGGGTHALSVRLRVTEPFGWGLALSLTGDGLDLLPPGL